MRTGTIDGQTGGQTGSTPDAAGRRPRGADRRGPDGRVSDRRAAANRANAARSTGPRTERGKAIARFNALRHGLAAQSALLPGEDDEALAELTAEFEADHAGGSAAERAVAGRLLSVVWKLRRLARAEEHVARRAELRDVRAWATRRAVLGIPLPPDGQELDGPDPMPMPSDGPEIVADDMSMTGRPGVIERLNGWEVRLGGQMMAACRALIAVRKAMGPGGGGQVGDGRGGGGQGHDPGDPLVTQSAADARGGHAIEDDVAEDAGAADEDGDGAAAADVTDVDNAEPDMGRSGARPASAGMSGAETSDVPPIAKVPLTDPVSQPVSDGGGQHAERPQPPGGQPRASTPTRPAENQPIDHRPARQEEPATTMTGSLSSRPMGGHAGPGTPSISSAATRAELVLGVPRRRPPNW
jgi:hypothetical protein